MSNEHHPVNEAVKRAYRRSLLLDEPLFAHEPCAREHLPGAVCVLPVDHPEAEAGTGWADEYTPIDTVEIDVGSQNPIIVGGFTIRSGVLPVQDRHYPTLIFDFSITSQQKVQPLVLVMDEEELGSVGRLVGNAAHGAIGAARSAEGRDPRTGRKTS
jgi:hypothetical protein